MPEYTQGVASDGPVILKDGKPMSVEDVIAELKNGVIVERALDDAIDQMISIDQQ